MRSHWASLPSNAPARCSLFMAPKSNVMRLRNSEIRRVHHPNVLGMKLALDLFVVFTSDTQSIRTTHCLMVKNHQPDCGIRSHSNRKHTSSRSTKVERFVLLLHVSHQKPINWDNTPAMAHQSKRRLRDANCQTLRWIDHNNPCEKQLDFDGFQRCVVTFIDTWFHGQSKMELAHFPNYLLAFCRPYRRFSHTQLLI